MHEACIARRSVPDPCLITILAVTPDHDVHFPMNERPFLYPILHLCVPFASTTIAGTVRVQAAAFAVRDPTQRIVITGMGISSVFGNDVDVFYNT